MHPAPAQYTVSRPLYSEDAFAQDYEKIYRHRKTLLNHLIEYFTCDAKRAKNAALSLFPIIGWMRIYRVKEWLASDIVSGISTGLVAVLQGAFPVLSLMVGATVTRLVPKEGMIVNITGMEGLSIDQQRVVVAASTTFLMGIMQLTMGVFQVGFIVMYLSDTLVSGFTTAAAVHILVSQLKFVLGLEVPGLSGPLSIIYTLEKVFVQITKTNIADLVTSIIVMVVVFIVKELNDRYKSKLPVPIPIEVIMTIIACGVSYAFNFKDKYSVDVVGEIPQGFTERIPMPTMPIVTPHEGEVVMQMEHMIATALQVKQIRDWTHQERILSRVQEWPSQDSRSSVCTIPEMQPYMRWQHELSMEEGFEPPMAPNLEIIQLTAVEAFPMAIVGFAVAFSVAKVYSIKHDYIIDGNQELIAFGVSNVFGASFRSFAASTALSRSAVQESTGGKTQSVLGAVVIINLKGMLMQFREIPYLWRKDRPDCVVWVVTCIASILLGLDLGLAVGLGAELISVVFRTQFPRCSVLANIRGTDIYKDRKDYLSIYEPDGVKIFRIPSPLFFANIEFFRGKLVEAVGFNPLRVLRKRNKALRKIKKLLKSGELQITDKGLLHTGSAPIDESEDESNMEDLDQPIDIQNIPIQVNWNARLPANICVPKVDIHSIILDFAAVSFLDISALKGLKAALKEFIRVDVEVYIVACDVYILEKMHSCNFFDNEVKTSIFFLTLHDAMLHILEKHPDHSVGRDIDVKVTDSETKF
ncbi:hypothetical protein GJAV_G00158770 [Gymnothorax javanicus]|nr:hypothetical protein GJAV_G00158770 [Gymnothorax javanicus]